MATSPSPLVPVTRALSRDVSALHFEAPTAYVYNPLEYARRPHEAYLTRYGKGAGRVLLLGMNPGPFGMAQTGVPFGDVSMVRDFLRIEAEVGRPESEHPARPVQGFACRRSEVSGTRLWGWARTRFGSAERFFERFFVFNYCPLAFLEESGKNRTPDHLPAAEQKALFDPCDNALRSIVKIIAPSLVVGVGAFAEARAQSALGDSVPVGVILHPSPANPQANRGWEKTIEGQLRKLGVKL